MVVRIQLKRMRPFACIALGLGWAAMLAAADWPMVRGDPQHTGFVPEQLSPPFRLAWAVEFEGERLGTAVEPIVNAGRVFIATHAGSLYALEAESGRLLWRFQAHGPFLHSPAADQGLVVVGSTDGCLYALDQVTGKPAWQWCDAPGGFAAAPVVASGRVFIGTRTGQFVALDVNSGQPIWRRAVGAPIRQTAAAVEDRVIVTPEDLRVRSYRVADGELLWTSEPLVGQTARDYYPVIVRTPARTWVVVRTNPLRGMGQHIGQDRSFLCRQACVSDRTWQEVDAWLKSDQARGTPELWAREQEAIAQYLETNPLARTFSVLDAQSGQLGPWAPVLWIGGCQSVGVQPALTSDGRLLVFYRTAYGNWNHGVAPLVGLGLLDLDTNRIEPLFHQQGRQPAWNCFWGTADESQNFLVVGDLALIIHQGTLSGFNLKRRELFRIWGERDTYGGFRNPPWARNEWHGPARSGLAVAGSRLYWQTGSRVLCLQAGQAGQARPAPQPKTIRGADLPTQTAAARPARARAALREQLARAVKELLDRPWAPLWVQPGLSGREFAFDHSGELFEALAWAWPHLPPELQGQVSARLRQEWTNHPPCTRQGWYALDQGQGREWAQVPQQLRSRDGVDRPPHPFGNLYAVWLWASRCGQTNWLMHQWPSLKTAFDQFAQTGWRMPTNRGDQYANRYLASLLAFDQVASAAGEPDLAQRTRAWANQTTEALVAWWQRTAQTGSLESFRGVSELDPFIGRGDGLSLAVAPHRHKVALFQDLAPEVARLLQARCPSAIGPVWNTFQRLYSTWWVVGEERQVHFGENFVDPPDLALGGFRAMAWLTPATGPELARRLDLPFCRADLYHIMKLGIALDRLPH
jgi:hypothetical protein